MKLNEVEDTGRASPVLYEDGTAFIYIQYSNLYLLAMARSNVNAAAVIVFLHKIVEIFKQYFQEVGLSYFTMSSQRPVHLGMRAKLTFRHLRRLPSPVPFSYVARRGIPQGQLCDRL